MASRRCKGNLLIYFEYSDLTESEQRAVKAAMERYNNQGKTHPSYLQQTYANPSKFYQDVIKRYGWNSV